MNGNWLRVTPAELARAKGDLDWAYDFTQAAVMDDENDRVDGTGTAWHAFDFLLERHDIDLAIVDGAEAFVATPVEEPEDESLEELEHDWGYGPPRYLTPEQVAAASMLLSALTEEDLSLGVDQAELERADIYPKVWDRPGQLSWVTHYLPYAQRFFAAAAKDGDAIICWLD